MMKNLKYNAAGGIDCLYNHYLYGYIPITIDPNDKDTSELYAEAVSGKHGAIAAADVVAVTAQKNALIFAEILKLESNQVRPVRELLIDPFNGFAKSSWLILIYRYQHLGRRSCYDPHRMASSRLGGIAGAVGLAT